MKESLIFGKEIVGFMCPGCHVFSCAINEISHHDGTCSNCHEYFVTKVKVTQFEKGTLDTGGGIK